MEKSFCLLNILRQLIVNINLILKNLADTASIAKTFYYLDQKI